MKKILYVSPFSHIGGAELSLLGILSQLDRSEWEPCVICFQRGPLVQRVKNLGIPVEVMERTGLFSQLAIVVKMIRFLKIRHVEIVHVNTLDIRAGLACLLAGVPFLGHLRVIFPFTWRDRLFVRLADRTISVSEAAISAFCSRHPGLLCGFTVIPNAIALKQDLKATDVRREYGLAPDTVLIGTVGRIDPFKGFEYFIEAAALIRKDVPKARFIIVGDPTPGSSSEQLYLQNLRLIVRSKNLEDHVIFTGFRNDVLEVMAACDIAVVASVNLKGTRGVSAEGFGRVAVEAMALQVPVIVTSVGGLPEIVQDNVSGLVVPEKDPGAICEAVICVLNDPDKAKMFRSQARKRFETLYALPDHLKAVTALYHQVLKARISRSRLLSPQERIKSFLRAVYFFMRLPVLALLRLFFRPRRAKGQVRRILLIRIDRLGDLVLSLPVIDDLKLSYPEAKLDILVVKAMRDIALMVKNIDRVIVHDSLFSSAKKLSANGYDIAIDLLADWRMDSALLALASAAPVRLGFAWGFRQIFFTHAVQWCKCLSMHLSDAHLALLSAIGVNPVVRDPVLHIEHGPREDVIVFAPGGTYVSQRWPEESFISLGKMVLEKYNCRIEVNGSAGEQELVRGIVGGIGDSRAKAFIGSLKDMVRLISRARLVVCNNSGPLHLAAALGVPTVSTMGPTDEVRFSPRGEGNIVISRDIPCRPCLKGRCSHLSCLRSISAEEMFEAVKQQLEQDRA